MGLFEDSMRGGGRALALVLLVAWCSSGLGACAPPTQASERPRLIVLVVLDTLAAGHVAHLGYDRGTTPALDSLASKGISFESAVTPATYTVAAVPSLFTGQLPERHGVTSYDYRLSSGQHTLAALLNEAGYRTFAAIANIAAGPRYGNDQGFDEFIETYIGDGPEGAVRWERRGQEMHIPSADAFPPLVSERLERLEPEEKLFLYLHFREPHGPYDPPLAFKQHFVDERAPKPYQEGDRPLIGRASRGHVPPPQEVIEQSVRLYDANILWADHNLGLVLDELRRRGLFDDALIIATSDHGEAFWQHGILGHGYGLYEEECRVPLIFKLPAGQGPRGDQVPVIASLMDVVPTLGEYLNLRRPEAPLDGRSLLPFLREPDTPDDGHRVLLRTHNEVGKFALRSSGQKVIVRTERDEHGELQVSRVELYDLERDPLELDDLASERADEAARWAAEIVALVGRLATESGTTAAELSDFELELLEQLGYVGGQDTGER